MAAAAALIGFLASSCGGEPSIVGTWRIDGRFGFVGERFLGTWGNEDGTTGAVDRLAFDGDGTWSWVTTRTYPSDSPRLAKCSDTTTWSGRFTRDPVLRVLHLAGSDGTFVRSGCKQPADNETSTEPALSGDVSYTTLSSFRSSVSYELTLNLNAIPGRGGRSPVFYRVDIANEQTLLTFDAGGTWRRITTRTYAAEAARAAGCQETVTQSGTYLFGPGGYPRNEFNPPHQDLCNGPCRRDLSVVSQEAATRVRTGCATPEADGQILEDAAISLGALGGLRLGWVLAGDDAPDTLGVFIDIEGHSIGTQFPRVATGQPH